MRVTLQTVDGKRVLALPEAVWQEYGIGDVVELIPVEGGVLLRPARPTFEDAKRRLFDGKAVLLRRLVDEN